MNLLSDVWVRASQQLLDFGGEISGNGFRGNVSKCTERETNNELILVVQVAFLNEEKSNICRREKTRTEKTKTKKKKKKKR